MEEPVLIPMFPLSILPLPDELVPLHIFEPRYQQLLQDAETKDTAFGIYFNHVRNTQKVGSWVRLESTLKRYAGGEADIVVRCIGSFKLQKLYRHYKDRLYPGGHVHFVDTDLNRPVSLRLLGAYQQFSIAPKAEVKQEKVSIYTIANELNFDLDDRLKFLALDTQRQESFILSRLRYQQELNRQAENAKDVFHLN